MLRIISGSLRGRTIRTPAGRGTRPTASRVREAIYDVIAHHPTHSLPFDGSRVLDLFAGSGAMGIEALSRGAAHACFVERDRRAAVGLRRTLADLGLEARTRVVPLPARAAVDLLGSEGATFDLLFLDPPYADVEDTEALLAALSGSTLLARPSLLVLERSAGGALPLIAALGAPLVRRWGTTEALVYRHD